MYPTDSVHQARRTFSCPPQLEPSPKRQSPTLLDRESRIVSFIQARSTESCARLPPLGTTVPNSKNDSFAVPGVLNGQDADVLLSCSSLQINSESQTQFLPMTALSSSLQMSKVPVVRLSAQLDVA